MANFTVADIKALREKTGAGMMDVKKALTEAEGDTAKAEEILRIKGAKTAAKRADRAASDGLVVSAIVEKDGGQRGILVEVNSETDFVSKNEKFIAMANEILEAAVASGAETIEELLKAPLGDATVADRVENMMGVIGEKLEISNLAILDGEHVEAYMHKTNPDLPPQVGVLVATDAAGASVAHDVAVHIAAFSPSYLDRDSVPAEVVENEERIATETTLAEGKPEKAVPNIVKGRMNGFFKQVCLLEQGFARDPKVAVGEVVKKSGGEVTGFVRIRVGESAAE